MSFKFFTGKSGEFVEVSDNLYFELTQRITEDNQSISDKELEERIKEIY